ncbi:MAG: 50S ribosomal protein L18 [Thermofilaceae archaeon]|nr:50S ribosomal protein L18 [Thermofilaceae archaeon]MCX8180631.1 50S ribosomal protein L18 [Thermofilaceae archaeon]MDW8003733.1 50S ribosomal protein L18 [Thermofilaceae archaeon]
MPKGGRFKVPFRRRREGVTNYYKRRKMILSGQPRFVVRITNRYVIAQVVKASPKGDLTLVSAHSGELAKYGWKGGTKNTPAAYLVGLLIGLRARNQGISNAILDIGLRSASTGARVFATAKGAIDAGLSISLGENVVPDEQRIKGLHIAEYYEKLDEEGLAEGKFSKYLKRGLKPSEICKNFEETRKILLQGLIN